MEWDFARHDPYTRRFRQIAQFDTDPTVKATAIRALNRARDVQSTKVFIRALGDPNEWVRLEGAKALANVPDVAAAEPLLQLLNRVDENRDVRVAAADALKHYRTLAVARGLVGGAGRSTLWRELAGAQKPALSVQSRLQVRPGGVAGISFRPGIACEIGFHMRALVFNKTLAFQPRHPDPAATDGDTLIRVRQAGICSTDLEIVKGYMGFAGVLGHEFVGEVVSVARQGSGRPARVRRDQCRLRAMRSVPVGPEQPLPQSNGAGDSQS